MASGRIPSPRHSSREAPNTTPKSAVLDRVAARVQQRLSAEQSGADRVVDGSHAASLISRP
ncbi:HaaA family cyclophane-containing RiPP peptide [Streptomyces asiaticus]|uniref:HaaA family cyclophane-containing RiPP peptide n=1 Tax=Streptomyces asiaticus TaxID=114695 RepID=UPI003F662417